MRILVDSIIELIQLLMQSSGIVWATTDDIDAFQRSPAYSEYLQQLDCTPETPFLRLVSLGQWSLMQNLDDLACLTKIFPRRSNSSWDDFWENVENIFLGFYPPGCDLRFGFRRIFSQSWVKVTTFRPSETSSELEATASEDWLGHIFHWTRNCDTREKEMALATDPAALLAWGSRLERAQEHVSSWQQELWQIKRYPWWDPQRRRIQVSTSSNEPSVPTNESIDRVVIPGVSVISIDDPFQQQ